MQMVEVHHPDSHLLCSFIHMECMSHPVVPVTTLTTPYSLLGMELLTAMATSSNTGL